MADTIAKKRVRVQQVRSGAARDVRFKATLQALGLGRIGACREYSVNPALAGMLKRVETVIKVSLVK